MISNCCIVEEPKLIGNNTNKRVSDAQPSAKLLLFGYGNPGRGDDALGPMLIEQIDQLKLGNVTCLVAMQLLIEHAVDLTGYDKVIFIDADMSCTKPFIFSEVQAEQDDSYTSHTLTPAALLFIYQQIYHHHAPPAFLLRIRGYQFELGDALSDQASLNLQAAMKHVQQLTSCQL